MICVVLLTSLKEEKDMLASHKVEANADVVTQVGFHEFGNAIKKPGVFWAATS
jgi:hypothetical protein